LQEAPSIPEQTTELSTDVVEKTEEQTLPESNEDDAEVSIWEEEELADVPEAADQLWFDPPAKGPDGPFPWST
jgi:hypothetical protein